MSMDFGTPASGNLVLAVEEPCTEHKTLGMDRWGCAAGTGEFMLQLYSKTNPEQSNFCYKVYFQAFVWLPGYNLINFLNLIWRQT